MFVKMPEFQETGTFPVACLERQTCVQYSNPYELLELYAHAAALKHTKFYENNHRSTHT